MANLKIFRPGHALLHKNLFPRYFSAVTIQFFTSHRTLCHLSNFTGRRTLCQFPTGFIPRVRYRSTNLSFDFISVTQTPLPAGGRSQRPGAWRTWWPSSPSPAASCRRCYAQKHLEGSCSPIFPREGFFYGRSCYPAAGRDPHCLGALLYPWHVETFHIQVYWMCLSPIFARLLLANLVARPACLICLGPLHWWRGLPLLLPALPAHPRAIGCAPLALLCLLQHLGVLPSQEDFTMNLWTVNTS